jgi:hypothetical protein
MLRLANDEIIEIENQQDVIPTSTPGTVIWTRWTTKSEVDKTVFTKLSASPISGTKFSVGGREQTNAIKEKQSKRIMEAAACIVAGQ